MMKIEIMKTLFSKFGELSDSQWELLVFCNINDSLFEDKTKRIIKYKKYWIRTINTWNYISDDLEDEYDKENLIIVSLMKHLFCKYEISDFLIHYCFFSFLHHHHVNKILFDMFIDLSKGESLFKNIKNDKYKIFDQNGTIFNFPPLTKKECEYFLKIKNLPIDNDGRCEAYLRIYHSIIISNGGSLKLSENILNSESLEGSEGSDIFDESKGLNIEYQIIKWFCKLERILISQQFEMNEFYNNIDPILDYMYNRFDNVPNYSLIGRTYNSICKQMEIWHRNLKLEKVSNYNTWKSTNYIKNFFFEDYSITEILNIQELYEEGKELEHCVLTYAEKIHNKKENNQLTIWSLKQNGKRLLTIAIDMNKNIKQIRGLKNRFATLQELIILDKWFKIEGMNKKYWKYFALIF